ncbi:hypothetical protein NUW54_g8653 [Trametes sanguinea]|uniref:Uncharacterized protein n=1 Tax=Trametes sanguinea TaxID=158606 RepID=A0ACC1PDD9_9APHY|nr:hypothetical protein NUW54_g8653 [Trametes sanguinea]
MWCFFYEPERLPQSYNKWIMTLANLDPRLLAALRAIRTGNFSYQKGISIPPDLVSSLSRDLGYPATWGDPAVLPAYGGPQATHAWKALGVSGRDGRGGLPCEIVHGDVTGGSCFANAFIRGIQAFAEAVAIYLPVHVLPILLTRPRKLLQVPNLVSTLLSVGRSASFLSAFVSSIWFAVCFTRTLVLARMFPGVPHDFWDGPFGCTFVGPSSTLFDARIVEPRRLYAHIVICKALLAHSKGTIHPQTGPPPHPAVPGSSTFCIPPPSAAAYDTASFLSGPLSNASGAQFCDKHVLVFRVLAAAQNRCAYTLRSRDRIKSVGERGRYVASAASATGSPLQRASAADASMIQTRRDEVLNHVSYHVLSPPPRLRSDASNSLRSHMLGILPM